MENLSYSLCWVCVFLLLSFFCHSISPCRKEVCSKKCVTFDPCSSCSVVLKTLNFDSSVRNSQMGWTGNTICSMLRSSRTIWTHTNDITELKPHQTNSTGYEGSKIIIHALRLSKYSTDTVLVLVPLSEQSAAHSTPVGPVPPRPLVPRTLTSGTEDGCSSWAADIQTTVRLLQYCSDISALISLRWLDVHHGGDPIFSLFTVLLRFQEVLQDFVVSGQLKAKTQDKISLLLVYIGKTTKGEDKWYRSVFYYSLPLGLILSTVLMRTSYCSF